MTEPIGPPPGWYADPSGEPQNRWWDGAVWQNATQQFVVSPTYAAPALYAVDPSIDTWTANAWLISLSPLALVALGVADIVLGRGVESSIVSLVGVYSLMLLPIVFGLFDYRTLRQRGIDRPFHWAWGFFGAVVYVVGRAAVAQQRTGHGLGPLWVFLGACAAAVLGLVVVSAWRVAG